MRFFNKKRPKVQEWIVCAVNKLEKLILSNQMRLNPSPLIDPRGSRTNAGLQTAAALRTVFLAVIRGRVERDLRRLSHLKRLSQRYSPPARPSTVHRPPSPKPHFRRREQRKTSSRENRGVDVIRKALCKKGGRALMIKKGIVCLGSKTSVLTQF